MSTSERTSEYIFRNGDVYLGNFKGVLPHGSGKYTWFDGTVYEGDWEEGKMTGKGKISWNSGAAYVGEFSGGYLHGFGTLTNPNGSVYRGSWRLNIQYGFGKKQYQNLDYYEGLWKEGVHEGSGSYVWSNGNMYIGSWKSGKICGRGVIKWSDGDLFDGFWLNGLRHGSGYYRFADGSYYFGTWTKGLKDGRGTYYPTGSKSPDIKNWCSFNIHKVDREGVLSRSLSVGLEESKVIKPSFKRSLSERISFTKYVRGSGRISSKSISLDEDWSLNNTTIDFATCDMSCMLSHSSGEGRKCTQDNDVVAYEREYMQGILIKERIMNKAGPSGKSRKRCKGKEATKKSCLNISKGNRSYFLMLNLQLGIRYTVGKITPVPLREVRVSDFGESARIKMYFPRKGSQFTPPHKSSDFYWMDYCPMVFRNLRDMFKLDAAEYMISICGDNGLREHSSSGKSGSIFYVSHDDKFVIKTLKRSELEVLLKMLPNYYDYVKEHDNTLITKFFGVHRIKWKCGKKVRFVVMGNMLRTELRIHHRYDLKGSCQGRVTNKDHIAANTTLKDRDLQYEFYMDRLLRESLFKQIYLDCMFLESQQIIDYSLLLGLHFRAPKHLKPLQESQDLLQGPENTSAGSGKASPGDLYVPPKGLLLVTHEPNIVNTTPGSHIRGNTLRAFSLGDREVDLLLPDTGRLRVQLGVNMPARASCKLLRDNIDSAEVELFEVYDVILFLGIIDILQEYNIKKKAEHAYKSIQFDSTSISVVEPKFYSRRLINFLESVILVENEEVVIVENEEV
ncbi:phosphatidylinositol 4-phosphate 5-kinase 7 [Daucus carota subsp. sativus]|uniref:phosphatidylinositol 4-phosphate 5-kinase 7 n=1 Tax=Daucus carota subsp. sativus TaxID=79200 RepID=UPI0007EFC5CF|nr:PREDICTED: phosphatidylinositol 4-phosphate 5-kinase 7-like [Daucus carota subsp. sativus]